MAESDHYCADCDTHFKADPKVHADAEHDGGFFRGVENGDWRDWDRMEFTL